MQMANYRVESRKLHGNFFTNHVAPVLGEGPTADGKPRLWKSFMTDDHSPVELSWTWAAAESLPLVRYSIEPIGQPTTDDLHLLHLQTSDDLVHKVETLVPEVNLEWYRHFFSGLLPGKASFESKLVDTGDHASQVFLGFELQDESMMLKVYFLPETKAIQVGLSKLSLMDQAITKLSNEALSLRNAFDMIAQYLFSFGLEMRPEVEIAAVDCVRTSVSRVKIYLRSRQTSFDSVVSMMTLGGKLRVGSKQGLASLQELWRLVFSLDLSVATSDPLHPNHHRTAGILYCFALTPGRQSPKSKVYIPVKHYGKNDLEVARGLSKYLTSRNKRLHGLDYVEAVQNLWFVALLPSNSALLN